MDKLTAIARKDIVSYTKSKQIYCPKGAKIQVRAYGESHNGERMYLCEYNNIKFTTLSSNIAIHDKRNNTAPDPNKK